MTTELTRYNGYRYVLRKGRSVTDDVERTEAGRAMLMHADMVVWESNPALVARVESFLLKEFSWYSRNSKSARETLQTLLAYVRDGAVVVLQENGATTDHFENGGFTLDPPARAARQDPPPFDYAARVAENSASLREYNDAIDARIERERRLNTPSFEDIKPLDMSFLLSVVGMVVRGENLRRQAMQKAALGFGEVADDTATPLGKAAPFEYVKSATSDDVLSIAARGVGEAQEADCHATYEFEMELCNFASAMFKDPRTYALCSQKAFSNYQFCRGY
ncbi:hypothetical protein SBC1_69680 (plasmid) [Caballeronia sp. SBC1]|uniref:hypothetical protein n=1 Tax=unclassified Caballeronia TaxID=2646786 RepID=UPI0013E0EEE5|nr:MULTISPECIES: hypothetical protein [unclassified Caballeronia]QIE28866.1 hypothetical protein SBC2_69420 [Caballeronia sp. SBC2]QIN66921.1 hypothetical protein SBC1_69680 [Caballeronia sp. SBC1]